MLSKVKEYYAKEHLFWTIPLSAIALAVILIRFATLPLLHETLSLRDQIQSQEVRAQEKSQLLAKIKTSAAKFGPVPSMQTVAIADESAMIEFLLAESKKAGITLSRTTPSRSENSVILQITYTAPWAQSQQFLRQLEHYPGTIAVMPLTLSQRGSLVEINATITASQKASAQ